MAMHEVGFEEVELYVLRRENTAAWCIIIQRILEICEEAMWMTEVWVTKRWWDQEGIDLE